MYESFDTPLPRLNVLLHSYECLTVLLHSKISKGLATQWPGLKVLLHSYYV